MIIDNIMRQSLIKLAGASQLVARPVLLRAALSEGSRRFADDDGGDLTGYDNDYHGIGM
jgi:hypothetical protein